MPTRRRLTRVSHLAAAAAATFTSSVAMLGSQWQPCVAMDPTATLLNRWPMIMAHDAATTYLVENPVDYTVYAWTMTQPPQKGTSGMLDCGARAFDWRPQIDDKTGDINMHHGGIEVHHKMHDALAEAVSWAAGKPNASDLVLFGITDCVGSNCTPRVKDLLTSLNVSYIDDCAVLSNLTVDDALNMGALDNGGHVLAMFDCWVANYDPSIACAGTDGQTTAGGSEPVSHRGSALRNGRKQPSSRAMVTPAADDGDDPNGRAYDCWQTTKTHDIPFQRMYTYLDSVEAAGPPSDGQLYTAQMLWQESPESVVIGASKLSSLLKDEEHSELNKNIVEQVRAGNYTKFNMYEINNVCDSGPELFAELKKLQGI